MFQRSKQVAAFTLMECLVSLLLIAGAVQVYQAMTQLLVVDMRHVKQQEAEDWILFGQQLSLELSETEFDRLVDNRLYVRKGNQELAFGQSKADDFRKTNADGRGYQPMLFGLSKTSITGDAKRIQIRLTFKNGLERTFIYAFENPT
ncbi:competence type IV pilus minor pilin ComGF [Streptococcus loxodontisalivarius]|uniref:Competence protein ComGF n=1 Tax=Streptococcus loxodontisalivarius TaxID=1349415 RepID=A0ABS2PUK0_9STRE|nr:competence type IV pilus minor pilin ComGF [Streptococcus loxodontisalivarius]MBM7643375.1 competence protein ComGF [Streptococcus loxodontisalivarius]